RQLGGLLGVDVDELVVVGDVREGVDLVLGDLEPVAGALGLTDGLLEQGVGVLCGSGHAPTLLPAPGPGRRRARVSRGGGHGAGPRASPAPAAPAAPGPPRRGRRAAAGVGASARPTG